jgi:hypothetical protein
VADRLFIYDNSEVERPYRKFARFDSGKRIDVSG